MAENEIKPAETKPAEKQPNLLFAILTAIGLGLVGCVLYGVLYYVGYVAWIASLVVVLASSWGYRYFYKKMDWKGYLTISIVSIVGLLITMFLALTIFVAKEFGMSFGAAFKQLFTLINDRSDIRAAVVKDGVLTAVFTLLGILFYWFYEFRAEKLVRKKQTNESQNKNVAENNSENTDNKTEVKTVEKTEENKPANVSDAEKPKATTKPATKTTNTKTTSLAKPTISNKPKATTQKTTQAKPKTIKNDDKKDE